jgi:hypothetical protein
VISENENRFSVLFGESRGVFFIGGKNYED